ncbi:uroporphyrinogen-III synthase HEM4 [Aspergillus homomorphus CBS 101889]|uniref:Tetrapyrrole biosynthesis, uroporphyrinogen III synthase n=1 Tax=Aspergillus homomorphus (strain CBS 101889) TaxID=1450537 RepID=A0A395HPW1_ASPHC|nr:tetrapyrrole biosynthesis, uroporphyrinogen III synthase [Aspergillus homomorphus CBS 101889]RAL09656.1 tetrapyrrole biosynthesis, uroporphyrinogen III synthase [Aspergillus homomorphus CBS 101889]
MPQEKEKRTPILLLKTRSTPDDSYDDFFRTNNYAPTFIPVLEHNFHTPNLQKVHDLLVSGGFDPDTPTQQYGGIIFTSQRAVEGFATVLEGIGHPLPEINLPLYTVGPATHRSLSTLTTTYLPNATLHGQDSGTGEALARFMLAHYPYPSPSPSGGSTEAEGQRPRKPLLFLVGEQRRDIIPKTLMDENLPVAERIQVDEVVVYETGVMEGFEGAFAERILREEAEGEEDRVVWTVVFSPTGCEAMVRVLEKVNSAGALSDLTSGRGKEKTRRFFVATIGPTTRDYLKNRVGFEPDVCAEKPSPEGVGMGIQKFMEEYRAGRK